jgi:hypothetical protein
MRDTIFDLMPLVFFGAIAIAIFQSLRKKWWSVGLSAGIAFAALIVGGFTEPPSNDSSPSAIAQVTASPEPMDSPEPTDSPTPGPCDVQTLRELDAAPGAAVLAGNDPGAAINAAADAENECSRSLDGEQAYRHILAAGALYLLGIHADDVNDREGFMQYAIDTVHIIMGAPDASPRTRAKAQEIIDTANEKLQELTQ